MENLCYNESFVQKLAYCIDISEESNSKREFKVVGIFLTSERCPRNETKAKKNLLTTWLLCRNSFHCILKTSISWKLNGYETHLPLTTSPY